MAMRVFNVGDVLAAGDVNEYLVNTRYVVKGADTSRASTTTLANDPDLTVAVDANKSYYLLANIMYTAVANTGDLKLAFTLPAGTTFTGTSLIVAVGTSNAVIGSYQASGALITASTTAPGAGPVVVPVAYSGVLSTAGTAGNLTFQWAQNASNGTPTVVKQGSHLFLRRVA